MGILVASSIFQDTKKLILIFKILAGDENGPPWTQKPES